MFYLIILNVLRDLKIVPLLQIWFKRISCIGSVQLGLYVKILLIDSNQRMPGSNQQEFVSVAVAIIEGPYLDTKSYPVCRAPDWQSRQLLFVISIELS